MSSPITFPSPIGGVPLSLDYGPSILFTVLYATVSVVFICRFILGASRTIAILGTFIVVSERVVIYGLRANQAHTPSKASNSSLTRYWQITYAISYLSVYSGLCVAMRSLFVKATIDPDNDQPQARRRFRQVFGISAILVWLPMTLGIVSGSLYPHAEVDSNTASTVQALRYVTTATAFLLILNLQGHALYGYFKLPRMNKGTVLLTFVVATLLNVVSIYRLVVMHFHTTSLTSMEPGSLNSPTSKATFYIFQVVPEFLAAAIMLSIDVRERFDTGLWGDRALGTKV